MKKVPSKVGIKKPLLNKVKTNIYIYIIFKYLERRRN